MVLLYDGDLFIAATAPIYLVRKNSAHCTLEAMNWITILILAAMMVAIILLRRSGLIAPAEAAAHLKNGALVIDVRTAGEFSSGHLPNAINLPLDGIETSLPREVKDKNQVLLLHCQAGGRSSQARKKLSALGYVNAYNMGSYSRAAQIVDGK